MSACVLRRRIEIACLGHLKWLHLAQQQRSGQRFGANYWVTGKLMIKPSSNSARIPVESFLATGFQILKAAAYMELEPDNDTAANLMSMWAPHWLLSMEISDKRKHYAWPHAEHEGVKIFRLDEHVWIWRALKSLEANERRAWNMMSEKVVKRRHPTYSRAQSQASLENALTSSECISDDTRTGLSRADIASLRKAFASEVFRREVTKRFTAENGTIRKRMLAVTRSPRRTRFLLHGRDTALFYDDMFDFFHDDASIQELWTNTISCQSYHDENQMSNWEKSLRYALCIMMGTRGLRINNKPPALLVQVGMEALFRSSGVNGIFPGHLQKQHFHHHASFEIPYILLTHANRVIEVYNRLARSRVERPRSALNSSFRLRDSSSLQGENFANQFSQVQGDASLLSCDAEQHQVLLRLSNFLLGRSGLSNLGDCEAWGTLREGNQQRLSVKKDMPFNDILDSSSIVELEDDWLFNYPELFTRREPDDSDFAKASKCLKRRLHSSKTTHKSGKSDRYDTAHQQ